MNKNSILRSILLIFILVSYLSSCATVKDDLITSKNDRDFLDASFSFTTSESFLNGKVSFLKQKEKLIINFKSSRFYPKFSLVFNNKDTYQLLVNNSFRNKAEKIIQKNDLSVFQPYQHYYQLETYL